MENYAQDRFLRILFITDVCEWREDPRCTFDDVVFADACRFWADRESDCHLRAALADEDFRAATPPPQFATMAATYRVLGQEPPPQAPRQRPIREAMEKRGLIAPDVKPVG